MKYDKMKLETYHKNVNVVNGANTNEVIARYQDGAWKVTDCVDNGCSTT